MSIPCKSEQSLLSHDEQQPVLASHHPAIYDASLDDLKGLRHRLRDLRDKERTLARGKQREARGKGDARGTSFPGTAERPFRRKQVFNAALKRVSKEIGRLEGIAARGELVAASQRALAAKRAAQFPPRPDAGYSAHEGMRSLPSQRRLFKVPPAKIGSISQATRNAQARRDARP
jgi:hypothetical protein